MINAPSGGNPSTDSGLGPVFARLLPAVAEHLAQYGARPLMSVAHYEEPDDDDGSIVVHAGFVIEAQPVVDDGVVRVVDLPPVEVASVIHTGSADTIAETYEDLARWIEHAGFCIAAPSRELYHEWSDEHPETNVVELQYPIAR